MAKVATQKDLIALANEQFSKLFSVINGMNEEDQKSDFRFDMEALMKKDGASHWSRDRNLSDVLTHLFEWHQLLIKWEEANSKGVETPFLPLPFTWKNYGEMNNQLREKNKNIQLQVAKEMLTKSHNEGIKIIEKYTDLELFTKRFYNWTGGTSLGQYINGPMVSHYDWAIKKIKQQIKALGNKE